MLSNDLGQASSELTTWAEGLERKAQQYNSLHTRMAATSATASSPDGRISVTVDGNGVPTNFVLAEAVRGTDPATISTTLMECMRRAQANLRRQVEELVHSTVGDDAPGANIVRQYADRFPDVVDEAATPPTESGADDIPEDDDRYFGRRSYLD